MFSFVLCTHGSAFIYVLNIYLCIQLFQIFVHKHLFGFWNKILQIYASKAFMSSYHETKVARGFTTSPILI